MRSVDSKHQETVKRKGIWRKVLPPDHTPQNLGSSLNRPESGAWIVLSVLGVRDIISDWDNLRLCLTIHDNISQGVEQLKNISVSSSRRYMSQQIPGYLYSLHLL